MRNINSSTLPTNIPLVPPDNSNSSEKGSWYHPEDNIEINETLFESNSGVFSAQSTPEEKKEVWFDARSETLQAYPAFEEEVWPDARSETLQAKPSSSTLETAYSQIPFTEDCCRSIQQLVQVIGKYGQSRILATCLAPFLPNIPTNIVIAANNLYTAVIEGRHLDTAALDFLGLAAGYLPENLNVVAGLAAIIRNTVTSWTDETFLQQFLGNEEDNTATNLFTALAVMSVTAQYCMKDNGAQQRAILKMPAFFAKIIIRANQYWNSLGMMASNLPSEAEKQQESNSLPQAPAFAVDTQVEITEMVRDGFTSPPRVTAFSSNSTTHPDSYIQESVTGQTTAAGTNKPLDVPEQLHHLAMSVFQQKSDLSSLSNCKQLRTETRQKIGETVTTYTGFNTKCDASVTPAPRTKAIDSLPVDNNGPRRQVSSSAGRSGGDALLPLMATATAAAAVPVASSAYLQALSSKTMFVAGTSFALGSLFMGGRLLHDHLKATTEQDDNGTVPETPIFVQELTQREENAIKDCKKDPVSNGGLYNDYVLSNMPAQTKFKIAKDEQPNVVTASNELRASMEAIVGERNLKEYGSLEELEKKFVTKLGKKLVRMLRNTIELAKKQVATISEKLHDPTKKPEILAYLSSAIGTKNAEVLEESYHRLQNTAFKADKWCKNPNHFVTFFERHNASVPPPRLGIKRPIVLVNKKDPLMLKISLKGLSEKVQEYVDKDSSGSIISELYDVLMRAIISQAGNTNDLFPLPKVESEQGLFLGSMQQAHNHFMLNSLLAKPAPCVEAIYPDDTAIRDILNKTHTEPLTNEMRSEAKKRLQNPQDEYFQRKTGKYNSSLEEQQKLKQAITWVFTGSESDFNASQFFYDPFYRADRLTANTDSVAIFLRDIGGEAAHHVLPKGDLFSNKEFQAFDKIKQAVLEEFTSLSKIVSDLARHLIFEKTGLDLDPKDIFLVQFKNNGTVVDENCITGHAHYSEPLSFQNLVEVLNDNFLVFNNRKIESIKKMFSSFAAQFVAAGNYPLDQRDNEEDAVLFSSPDRLSGLYLGVNSTTRAFNNENEIKYLPSQLKADITNLDVMQQVTQRLDAFWGKHAEDWRTIAKGEFIAKLRLAYAKGAISKKGYEAAMKGGASNILLYDTANIEEISEHSFPDRSVQVSFLSLDLQGQSHIRPVRYSYKTDIVCFTDQEGREIFYLPRSDKPFIEFQTKQELQKWLMQQIGDKKRDGLLQNVSKSDLLKLEPMLKKIPRNSLFFKDDFSTLILELAKENINQDIFSTLAERTEKRSHEDADTAIRSNGEAVLGMLSLGLTLTNLIISPFLPMLGPLGWGIGLGLSSAQIVTNILRLHASDTPEESFDAEMNIGMDLLFLFFDGVGGIAPKLFRKSDVSVRRPAAPIPKKQLVSLHDIDPIGGNSLSGQGAITAKGVQLPQGQKPFGTQLNFPFIDEVIDLEAISNTKKHLQQKIFSQVSQSAELVRFRDNPKDACFWAISSVHTALKEQGEKTQVVALLIYKNPWDKEPINHYASMLNKDDVTYIIDPTIRQFDPSLPNESTILTLQEWSDEMLAKPGAGKDKMIIMGTYNTIIQARDNLADPLVSFKNYYEIDFSKNENVHFLKYGNSLFNSIVIERRNIIEKMQTLSENSGLYMENYKKLQTLNSLKTQFKIIDPNEIEITAQISNTFKSAIKKYSVPTSEIPALSSIADYRDITSTFSGENYIKVNANEWIKIEKAEDSNYFLIYKKQKVQLMHFDTNQQKWVFSHL